MILLDTDVMIDLLRQYPPALIWLGSLGEEEIILPGFVVMELIQGARNKVEQERIEKELRSYGIGWPSSEMCDEALSVFARYYLSHGLGILDALIGQMAVALDLPLYTFNRGHYEAIPNLRTMQPYEKGPQKAVTEETP
jgi:predicted nucleic acid-binding protein